MGWHRPLQYVFCSVVKETPEDSGEEDEVFYEDLDDPEPFGREDVNYYRPILKRLGVTVPEAMLRAIEEDRRRNEGDKVVNWPPLTQ
jgi:hypothetical protein